MATTQRTTPETCAYCGTSVDAEQGYRRHLRRAHERSELGAIDRRRYDRYSPEPNAVVRAGGEVVDRLDALRYPVDGGTMARYGAYGLVSSALVAALLGMGL